MELTFSSAASVISVTPVLAAQIQAATAALPAAHRVAPICESALSALQQHSSLPPGEAEHYAAKFASGTGKLAV